jgi:hypothetical protein
MVQLPDIIPSMPYPPDDVETNMKHSGIRCDVVWKVVFGALMLACLTLTGGCARSTLNGWAQNSPVIQPLPPVVHLGVTGE